MANGSMLPPDVRAQVEKQQAAQRPSSRPGGGIGGAARENAATARQRELAMNPDAALEDTDLQPQAVVDDESEDLKACPNPRCKKDVAAEHNFCPKCGTDLLRGGPGAKIGVSFSDDDIGDYIFKGYVVKELKLFGSHKITVKSSQAKDTDEIDDYMMNGDWAKNDDGSRRQISEFYLRQMNSCCVTAAGVLKFDGQSIGETLEARVKFLMERGSAFVDTVANRVVMFNQALTEHLKKEDAISGS